PPAPPGPRGAPRRRTAPPARRRPNGPPPPPAAPGPPRPAELYAQPAGGVGGQPSSASRVRRRSKAYQPNASARANAPAASTPAMTRGKPRRRMPTPEQASAAVDAMARRSPPATRRNATTATAPSSY